MKRPIESDYTSHTAYTRALEAYCDWLETLQATVKQSLSVEIKGVPV